MTWGFALVGFVLLPYWVRQNEPGIPAGLAALLIAGALSTDQLIAINAASGMEGGLVALATLMVAALAYRPDKLALLAPTLVVVRPEFGLVTLLQPVLGREWQRRAAIAGATIFATVTVARLLVFHDIFPNTFWAKSGGTTDHLASGIDYLWTSYSRFPLAALVVLGFLSRAKALRYLAAVLCLWSAYFLWSGGDFYSYARLFVFLVPLAYFVAIGSGLELLDRLVAPMGRSAIAAALVIVLVWLGHGFRDKYDASGGFDNVQRWSHTGRFLRRCLPGASIAATPIGALAYFSKSPVYDLVGLTDPKLAIEGKRATGPDFIVAHERYDGAWVLSLEPDVVFLDFHASTPIDSKKRIDVRMISERDILDEIVKSRAPYAAFSPEVSPGDYQFLLIRRDTLAAAVQRSPACFE